MRARSAMLTRRSILTTVLGTTGALLAAGAKGRAVLHDIDVYLQGINAYLRTYGHTLGPFTRVAALTRTDIYAFDALKSQQSPRMVANRRGRSVTDIISRREGAKGAEASA